MKEFHGGNKPTSPTRKRGIKTQESSLARRARCRGVQWDIGAKVGRM
jgi:hypothetical protein